MNSTKDNWIKAFDEKFPYNGCIFEDDGRSYNFDDIKSFISQVENDAIEKTNKRWSDNSLETLLALNNDGSITIHDQSLISRICKAFELKHEKNLFIKLITSDLLEYKERV